MKELPIDPSFGSHFFQNITSLHIPYFTVDAKQKFDEINLSFLKDFKAEISGKYVDWYSFENTFSVVVDGSSGVGIIELPMESKQFETMDEEESSGI